MNKCKMCGMNISADAHECPHCKFKISSSNKVDGFQKNVKIGMKGYFAYIIGAVALSIIIFIFIVVVIFKLYLWIDF